MDHRQDGAGTVFEPCRAIGRHHFADWRVLPGDGCGSSDRGAQFVTAGGGQRVFAFASVLEAEQHRSATLLLGAREFGAVGSGEVDPQCVRR